MSWSYYTIVYYKYVLNENYVCKLQYIRNINIYKYIKQERIKCQLVNLFQKCSEYDDTLSNGILFITHDESSPPATFHLAASKVMLVSTPL